MNYNDRVKEALACVDKARTQAGAAPWLVGYDINGIQEYVTANSRPIAMRGASLVIKNFDDTLRREGAIFAGGGRGILLVPGERCQQFVEQLPKKYAELSICGVLAAAAVPLHTGEEWASLRWLRLKLQNAKDAAPPPKDRAPATKASQCDRCRMYEAEYLTKTGGQPENICARCETITTLGQKNAATVDQRGLSLAELASRGYVAAVSADGNSMGRLFEELDSLEALAVVSTVIKQLFSDAHSGALQEAGAEQFVDPVTGGDDIRVFFQPECVAPYVGALARKIKEGASSFGLLRGTLTQKQADFLSGIGIGIGVAVTSEKTPASSMLQRAHELERSAKRLCLQGTRSAVDFAWFSSDAAYSKEMSLDNGIARGQRPVALDDEWDAYVHKTQCLRHVPAAQRAILAERRNMIEEEFANFFRYQVARSKHWQDWFKAIGSDWSDTSRVLADMPDLGMLELLRMLKGEK